MQRKDSTVQATPARRPELPLMLPEDVSHRLTLILVRRMVAHGFNDARATMLAVDHFGPGFRKVLLLTRCLLVELARHSRRRIHLAPCCAPGMTADEGLLLDLLGDGGLATYCALTDDAKCTSPLTTAAALAETLKDAAISRNWPR